MPRKKKDDDNGTQVGNLSTGLGKELGITGLKRYGGYIDEEFQLWLKRERGLKAYREMSDNDPIIGAMLFSVEMLIRGVSWSVEPVSSDKDDTERGEFLESCMSDMDQPWTEFIAEVLTMLSYGFAVHELVYKVRRGLSAKVSSQHDDGKIGWKRIPIRSQDTIDQWRFGEGNEIVGLVQIAPPDFRFVEIPEKKLILFRTTGRKGNPEGKSVLRNAARPWYFKKRIEEFQAIGVERDLAGLPMALVPPDLLHENAGAREKALLEEIKKIVRNVRVDSQAGIVFPLSYDEQGNKIYDFTLLGPSSTKSMNAKEIISYYDQRIAMVVLADFILLGHEKVGSFALASNKTKMFAIAIGAWMDAICETFNRVAVTRLFALNGWQGPVPQLVHGDIETPDLEELGKYIATLSGSGAELFPDEKLERHLRRVASLPEKEE